MALGKENDAAPLKGSPSNREGRTVGARPKPGIADYIAGETRSFVGNLYPYLPAELIGGAVPHIPGREEEAVWNAASQACATEKVHFCYSIGQGRIWYLACPSSALASHPDSWCPLAAALPGNSEYWDQETVYLYEQEGLASALRWDPETHRMQVFLGAARTILPRIQSMDANFVTISPDVADIVPWQNRNLKTEKLSRATVNFLLVAGITVCFIEALLLSFGLISINVLERDLISVKQETDKAAEDLMWNAAKIMQSDTPKHMVRIQELLDHLAKVNGTLVKYEVDKGSLTWEGLVPQAFTNEFPAVKVLDLDKDGRVRIRGTS